MTQEPLIGISEASHILGVSETALRQWTDEGKIRAFITPGGHRRYSKVDLRKFMRAHPRMLGIKDLVIEIEDTVLLHREIGRTYLSASLWYDKLNEESKEHLADLGRRLLNLIIRYITEPSKREETTEQARGVGQDHGQMLAELGLTLTDSVEAFVAHRDPIMNAATHLLSKREAFTGRVVEAIPIVARVMDEALVSLVSAHQQRRNEIGGGLERGSTG